MKKRFHLLAQPVLIVCLGMMLLLSQMSGLHMHVEHEKDMGSGMGHIIDVHAATNFHELSAAAGHAHGPQDEHHPVVLDISTDYTIQKIKVLDSLLVIAFIIGLALVMPRLIGRCRPRHDQTIPLLRFSQLRPPLRAPPAH